MSSIRLAREEEDRILEALITASEAKFDKMILDELYRKFDVKGEEEKWSMIQIIHSLVCHELESRVTKFSEVELISKILGLLGLGRTIELNRARERFVEVLEHDIAGYFWDDFEDEEEDEGGRR